MQTEEKSFNADLLMAISKQPSTTEELFKLQKDKIQAIKKIKNKSNKDQKVVLE